MITALDVWARHADLRSDLSALPTAEARAEVVRPLLAKLGKLCVIVDDVWDADSFNILRSAIPAGCPLLITTRDADLAKTLRCRVERIDALSDDEALELLAKLLGPVNVYKDAACDIAHLTEGLPLALELIAGLADDPADLPTLAQKLRTKPMLDVLKRGTVREQSIEACFTLSYEHLDADLQRRFSALGVFALAPFERDAIAAVWDDEDADAVDAAIQMLVRRSLLTRVILSPEGTKNLVRPISTPRTPPAAHAPDDTPGQSDTDVEYRQHALLHDYALKLLRATPSPIRGSDNDDENATDDQRIGEGRGEAFFASRHAGYYRAFAKLQNWRAVEHFFDQIEHGWQWVQVNAPEQIIDYVFAVRVFFNMRGRALEHIAWQNIALERARAVNDRKNEGTILNNLGSVYDALGQKAQALDYYQQAQALDYYQQALAFHREVGDRSGEGTTLNNIGAVYRTLGQPDKALEYYEQALAINREVGDRSGEGATLNNLGLVYDTLGQPDKALDFYQQALGIRREVGSRSGEGTTLNNLGAVYRALGQMDKALEHYEQALIIKREVGERWGESITLSNIGLLLDKMGRTAEAVEYLEQCVALDEAIGHPNLESDRAVLEEVRAKLQGNG